MKILFIWKAAQFRCFLVLDFLSNHRARRAQLTLKTNESTRARATTTKHYLPGEQNGLRWAGAWRDSALLLNTGIRCLPVSFSFTEYSSMCRNSGTALLQIRSNISYLCLSAETRRGRERDAMIEAKFGREIRNSPLQYVCMHVRRFIVWKQRVNGVPQDGMNMGPGRELGVESRAARGAAM